MIYYRFIPVGSNLSENDYIKDLDGNVRSFGMNTTHYNNVRKARKKYNETNPENKLPVLDDYLKSYDSRTGYAIDGTKLPTGYHPLHDKYLKCKETGKLLNIDAVHKHYYFGMYITLLTREVGTKSHGCVLWENISSKEPTTVNKIIENNKKYELIDK